MQFIKNKKFTVLIFLFIILSFIIAILTRISINEESNLSEVLQKLNNYPFYPNYEEDIKMESFKELQEESDIIAIVTPTGDSVILGDSVITKVKVDNILKGECEECVINLTTRDMVKITDYCGVVSGKREDKISKLGLKLNSGVAIDTPSLEISPVALECKLKSITPLGTHDMFLLDVINVKVNENLLDEKGKIHFEKANLIAYSHGEYFGLDSKPLGSFGYSIRKKTESRKGKNAKNKRQLKNYKKNRSLDKNKFFCTVHRTVLDVYNCETYNRQRIFRQKMEEISWH